MTLQRYLTGLIWLCIAPLLLLGAAFAIEHVLDVRAESEADARELLRRVSSAVDEDLRDQINGLALLADSPLAEDPARVADYYREAQNFRRHFGSHVVRVDADGQTIAFSTRVPLGAALPPLPRPDGRSAVQLARSGGQPVVGDLFRGPAGEQDMVAVAVPAMRDGAARFVLVAAIEAARFTQRLAAMSLPPAWSVTLHDSQGGVLASHGGARGAPGAQPLQFDGKLDVVPWRVALEVPRVVYMAPIVSAAAAVCSGLAVLTLAGVLGGGIAARRLTRSIESLLHPDNLDIEASPPPLIHEVAHARELLLDANRRREQAEAERRDEEQRYREAMLQASLKLQVSQARLRGIFDTASEGIITADASQAIVMINAAAAQVFGYQPDQLLGQPLERLIPERFRARHRQAIVAFGESEATARSMSGRPPLPALHADGHEFPVEAAISHVHVDGQRLYTVILRDVSERLRTDQQIHRMHAELQASHAELRRLVAAQDNVQEAERKRVARELHDDLQQTLAAIKMDTLAIGQQLQRDPGRIPPMLAKIDELATSAIASTRRIVNDLRPQMLEELGLRAALEALAADFTQRTGIDCKVDADDSDGDDDALAATVATCLYRVAQESLTNVRKHAGARHVRIALAYPDGRARLRISDDGRGLAPDDRGKRHSFGLVGMNERVRAVGGTLRVHGSAGAGTVIDVEVPLTGDAPVTAY